MLKTFRLQQYREAFKTAGIQDRKDCTIWRKEIIRKNLLRRHRLTDLLDDRQAFIKALDFYRRHGRRAFSIRRISTNILPIVLVCHCPGTSQNHTIILRHYEPAEGQIQGRVEIETLWSQRRKRYRERPPNRPPKDKRGPVTRTKPRQLSYKRH